MRDLVRFFSVLVACSLVSALLPACAAPASKSGQKPAKVAVTVSPETVAPGGTAEVTVRLTPASGIKINRYPKIKFNVSARDGVVEGAETTLGNDSPI